MSGRAIATIAVAVARRPSLWRVAIRQWSRTVPTRWWRRWPPLPVPTAEYIRFRLLTQYGGGAGPSGLAGTGSAETRRAPSADDVVHYLAWCASQP